MPEKIPSRYHPLPASCDSWSVKARFQHEPNALASDATEKARGYRLRLTICILIFRSDERLVSRLAGIHGGNFAGEVLLHNRAAEA